MRKFDAEHNDFQDRHLGLSRNDYRNLDDPDAPEGEMPPGDRDMRQDLKKSANGGPGARASGGLGTGEQAPDITTKIETKAPPIPSLAQILATPQPPKIGETQLVSIAVTDDVPLKDVLIELGRLANVDIELDAGISGGISFTANDRPFNEVVARIADLAGLRYTMKNGVLRVERDTPYIRNYSLDFLNIVRDSTSSVSISTNVLGGGGGGGGGGGSSGGSSGGGSSGGGGGGSGGINTGSSSAITSSTKSDLWLSLESGIKEILAYAPAKRVSPLASTVAEVDQARADEATANAAAGPAGATGAMPVGGASPAGAAGSTAQSGGTGAGSGKGSADTFYILNRQAGMITVSANDKQQQLIQTFLEKMRSSSSAQVLIEAKIVEVTLNEHYQSGIQWSVLGSKYNVNFTGSALTQSDSNTSGAATAIQLGDGKDLTNLINLIEEFGTTRTLSSPRLSAINNQQAVLTFARNQVYFTLKVDQSTTTSVGNISQQQPPTVTSTIQTVPIGLILSLQPSINLDSNEVTLNVRPTLSRLAGQVADPAAAYLAASLPASSAAASIKSNVPIVEVRELDSILKVKSGEVMVIGGLMEQGGTSQDAGVPFFSDVPWVGNLFKNTNKTNTSTELVIFIRATIVDSNGSSHAADQKIYDKFTRDPRPLNF